jgi:hypothetical protein
MQTSSLMLAVGPVSCLGRGVSAAPEVAIALGHDIGEPSEGPVNHYWDDWRGWEQPNHPVRMMRRDRVSFIVIEG